MFHNFLKCIHICIHFFISIWFSNGQEKEFKYQSYIDTLEINGFIVIPIDSIDTLKSDDPIKYFTIEKNNIRLTEENKLLREINEDQNHQQVILKTMAFPTIILLSLIAIYQ